jgi:hypothetical protein
MRFVSVTLILLSMMVMSGCASALPGSTAAAIRIDEVVAMSRRGESDAAIIADIQQRGAAFVLTPDDLEQQRAAGLSDGVLRYLQGRSDADQALKTRILAGRYPAPSYYGSSYLGYSYLGYHAGRHYYGGAPHNYQGGHIPSHSGGHHGGGHH